MSERIHYTVGSDYAEEVPETTALPHRSVWFDEHGDATVAMHRGGRIEAVVMQISAAELRLLARAARRDARRRFWAQLRSR